MKIVLNTEICAKMGVDIIDYVIIKMIYTSTSKGGKCFISYETMGEYLGLNKSTIQRRIKSLQERGLIYSQDCFKWLSSDCKEFISKNDCGVNYGAKKENSYNLTKKNKSPHKRNETLPEWFAKYEKDFEKKLQQEQESQQLSEEEKKQILENANNLFS